MSQQQQSRRLSLAAIKIQRIYRGHISRRETKKLWKKMSERRKIIQQLVLTEQRYIHDLSVIISDFQFYLFNSKIILSHQVYILFANVDSIRQLNQQFFVAISNAFQTYWHYKIIFLQVKKHISFFKIYFQYLNNFTSSMGLLKRLKETNGRFKEFLLTIKKNSVYNNLDLEDYLIKPVQRLPKYVLLLKLLLKKTSIDHPDYKNIQKVLACFEQVNSSNNQKLNKLVNNFKLAELQKQAKLPFHITEPGTEFIMEENVTILNTYNKVQDAVLYLLNNRVILTKKTKQEQIFLQTVNFRYGASLMQNQDQELYGNCFTLQSIDGDSITFLCQTQKEMIEIVDRIQQQIVLIEKRIFDKYSALQNLNNASQSFIKNITRFDLMPEVLVLGTEERTDKMLKYTTYIIEVKVKNVRQKIFIRYKELLETQQLMRMEFPEVEIKQSLLKTTWLLNHKPKTIQERKMRIQRFLTEILSKPQIIHSGGRILAKLGLPEDMYSLPDKIKASQSFMNRSGISHSKIEKSMVESRDRQLGMKKRNKTRHERSNYRLSIFEDLSDDDQRRGPHKQSMNSSSKGSKRRRLNIQSMLYANQLDLGHYTRYSQNTHFSGKKQLTIDILIPWIENSKGIVKRSVDIIECQRVAVLINKLARDIELNYYKDFRLFLQKEYSEMRVLDDDQIMGKVVREMADGGLHLVFKKMIFIDRQSQQHQIKHDRLRLKLIASQVIYEVKKSKYRLNYSKFLTLSVLIGVIQHQTRLSSFSKQQHHHHRQLLNQNYSFNKNKSQKARQSKQSSQMRGTFKGLVDGQIVQPNYKQLALSTRWLLANPYSSFFQNDKVWIKDYTQTLRTFYCKLRRIARGNSMLLRGSYLTQQQQQIWSGVVELSYISIIDEIKSNQLFGSMGYVVQISQQFRQVLMENLQEMEDESGLRAETKQNRNIWLIVKCSAMYLYSINLRTKLYEMSYQDIDRILCYPSSLILLFKDSLSSKLCSLEQQQSSPDPYQYQQSQQKIAQQTTLVQSHNLQTVPQSIKLKTTTSYSIKELINYYKNFNDLAVKMKQNELFQQSILEMVYENEKVLHSGNYQSVLIDYDDEEECL